MKLIICPLGTIIFLVLKSLSLKIDTGNLTAVIGPNGAGKSTLFKILTGQETPDTGAIEYGDTVNEIVGLGIIHVPEGRMILSRLTVRENLIMGSFQRKDNLQIKKDFDKVLSMFPILADRLTQLGGHSKWW